MDDHRRVRYDVFPIAPDSAHLSSSNHVLLAYDPMVQTVVNVGQY